MRHYQIVNKALRVGYRNAIVHAYDTHNTYNNYTINWVCPTWRGSLKGLEDHLESALKAYSERRRQCVAGTYQSTTVV